MNFCISDFFWYNDKFTVAWIDCNWLGLLALSTAQEELSITLQRRLWYEIWSSFINALIIDKILFRILILNLLTSTLARPDIANAVGWSLWRCIIHFSSKKKIKFTKVISISHFHLKLFAIMIWILFNERSFHRKKKNFF